MKKATRRELKVIRPKMVPGVWSEIEDVLKARGTVWIAEDFEATLKKAQVDPNIIVILLQYPVIFRRERYVMCHNSGKLILGNRHDQRHDD